MDKVHKETVSNETEIQTAMFDDNNNAVVDEDLDYLDDGIKINIDAEENDFQSETDYEVDDQEEQETLENNPIVETPDPEISFAICKVEAHQSPMQMQKLMEQIPGLDNMVKQMVEKQVNETLQSRGEKNDLFHTPNKGSGTQRGTPNRENRESGANPMEKSPSNTTIYAPALRLNSKRGGQNSDIIDKISNFVEAIHVETHPRDDRNDRGDEPGPSQARVNSTVVAPQMNPEFEAASGKADKLILDAEKFSAKVAPPQGKNELPQPNLTMQFGQGCGLSDDEFFHLTCHIDSSLHDKIEKGDYVDLEKLLPKNTPNPGASTSSADGGSRLEWIYRDGQMFLAPANNKSSKISSFRRWEQAFRMYATIYCGANPSRAREIWQYISTINTAANSYVWDNVYSYDVIFRHLMAFNPERSWATTYNQMWNLSMREPLPPRNSSGGYKFNAGGSMANMSTQFSQNHQKGNPKKGKKSGYCWNFNKGIPCKFGPKCRFIERCSYCNSSSHGLNTCPKAKEKNAEKAHFNSPSSLETGNK